MRTLHVLEATEGGTRRWLWDVLHGLDPAEFSQGCVVSLRRDGRFADVLRAFRQRGHACRVVNMERAVRPLRDALSLRGLVHAIREMGCDVIHGHSAKGGMLARAAGRLLSKPVIYTPHAFPFLHASPVSVIYRLAERAAISSTTLLHAVSGSEAEAAVRLGYRPGRVRVIPNGVDSAQIAPRTGTAPVNLAVVGALGRLRPQKSPGTFVEACREVCRFRRDVRFVWGGDGPLGPAMARRIAQFGLGDHCCLTGHVDDDGSFLGGIGIFVQCSRYEGLSYTLLDAMSRGLPIVATGVPGNADAIEDGRSGLLVPPGDAVAVARAIERLLDDPEEAARLGAGARERVLREFSLARQLDSLGALYREAAALGEGR